MADWLQCLKGWADVVTCLALVPGGLFALWQWRKARLVTRVEHLRQILMDVKGDGIAETFYECIERLDTEGRAVIFYEGDLRMCDGFEARVDKMLMYFSLICHEHRTGIIDNTEFDYFSYQIHRALKNPQVRKYLQDLIEHVLDQEKDCFMFTDLLYEGVSVDEDFYRSLYSRVKEKSLVKSLFEKCKEFILWRE